MSSSNRTKLNRLQHILPTGLVVDASWLGRNHYSSELRSRYLKSGWLERPARGVYRRPGGKLHWEQVVISLQNLMNLPVIVGGRTALDQRGFTHYVPPERPAEVHLYAEESLPRWLDKLDLDVQFVSHNARRLFRSHSIAADLERLGWDPGTHSFRGTSEIQDNSIKSIDWGPWNWPMIASVPERAVLELLDEVPRDESFEQADKIIESLQTLSPRRLQTLLEDCRSIKVKRLFFWFAERHEFRWLARIDKDAVDLGKGKRMLVRGGKLDPTYLITVPEVFHEG